MVQLRRNAKQARANTAQFRGSRFGSQAGQQGSEAHQSRSCRIEAGSGKLYVPPDPGPLFFPKGRGLNL